jgi:hypothetical protein
MAFGFLIDRSEVLLPQPRAAGAWLAIAFIVLGVVLEFLAIAQYRRSLAGLRAAEVPPGYWVNLSVYASVLIAMLGMALALYLVVL